MLSVKLMKLEKELKSLQEFADKPNRDDSKPGLSKEKGGLSDIKLPKLQIKGTQINTYETQTPGMKSLGHEKLQASDGSPIGGGRNFLKVYTHGISGANKQSNLLHNKHLKPLSISPQINKENKTEQLLSPTADLAQSHKKQLLPRLVPRDAQKEPSQSAFNIQTRQNLKFFGKPLDETSQERTNESKFKQNSGLVQKLSGFNNSHQAPLQKGVSDMEFSDNSPQNLPEEQILVTKNKENTVSEDKGEISNALERPKSKTQPKY